MKIIIVFSSLLLFCTNILTGFRTDLSAGQKSTIKIGLLIQDNKSVEAIQGAEIALLRANSNGGYKGRMFELVIKSMEGPWGTGSKQAVDMIFADDVIAIVGSHDGRNAHLVEQATTKSHVTFLSAWAADPTLSQAFTPWFFNAVPNDNQQAQMLVEEILKKKFKKLTLVVDDDYDAKSSFNSFIRKSAEMNLLNPVTIVPENTDMDMSKTAGMIIRTKPDCLILFTVPATAEKIIRKVIEMKHPVPVYGPLSLLGESSPLYSYPEVLKNLLLLSSGDWFLKDRSEFAAAYQKKYGYYPGAPAAYAHDAISIMINAIKAAGAERENVQKALMGAGLNGTTGTIKFDERGNRISTITGSE